MRIAYVTPFYNGACDGRYGRFHDWIHTARDMDSPPFQFDVLAFTASNLDNTLGIQPHQYLGDATSLWGTKKNKIEFFLNARNVRRALRNREYDLVHVLVLDSIIYPTVLSVDLDVPLVVGPDIMGWSPVREVPYWEETRSQRIKNYLRYAFKNVLGTLAPYDQVISLGVHHKNILESFSIPQNKITALKPGVSNKFKYSYKNNSDKNLVDTNSGTVPEILYVGDFSDHKGYPLFLRALNHLDEDVSARVIGSGDPRRELIESLGLSDLVQVEGFVPRTELPRYYQEASLYVTPSIDEVGPNTQIEALAAGTPVVATDNPGLNEYAPEDAAIYFSPREPEILAEALAESINKLESMSRVAQKKADSFCAEIPLQQLSDLYNSLLHSRSS